MVLMPRVLGTLVVLLILTLGVQPAVSQPKFPPLTGRVVDNANLLSPSDRAEIAAQLKALEEKGSDQLVVVTLPSLQGYTIEDFGYQLGRHWGIGTAKLDNGVLLIVAPKERKVRIEVGRGLEPILTDALSRFIIETSILPRFRSGDYPAGIKAGVRDIVDVLTDDTAELEERWNARRDADNPALDSIMTIIWIIIIFYVIYSNFRASMQPGGRYKSGRGGRGGGGFRGGGGGFGGGGASGGW